MIKTRLAVFTQTSIICSSKCHVKNYFPIYLSNFFFFFDRVSSKSQTFFYKLCITLDRSKISAIVFTHLVGETSNKTAILQPRVLFLLLCLSLVLLPFLAPIFIFFLVISPFFSSIKSLFFEGINVSPFLNRMDPP